MSGFSLSYRGYNLRNPFNKEYIPRPTAKLSILRILDLCPIFEFVPELICPTRFMVIEIQLP